VLIHLHDKRRELAQWPQKLQHAIAGFPLLFTGLRNLSDEAERTVAIAEIAIAILVLGALAVELRAARHHAKAGTQHHPAFGWFDLAAGAMLIFEAFHGATHKPGYLRPQFLSGVSTIGIGVFHKRLHSFHQRRTYLKVDESGVEYRGGRFRRFSAAWQELETVSIDKKRVQFEWKAGRRRRIALTRYRNAEAARQALADHARAAGVGVS
jgi:hypothetical protein